MKKLVTFALLLTVICVGVFTFSASTNKVSAHALTTCQITAWYQVEGPTTIFGSDGSSAKVWLDAEKDLNNGTYCGYLHTNMDYTPAPGGTTFNTAVWDSSGSGTAYGTRYTGVVTSPGSIQSSFVHVASITTCRWAGKGVAHLTDGYTSCYVP